MAYNHYKVLFISLMSNKLPKKLIKNNKRFKFKKMFIHRER